MTLIHELQTAIRKRRAYMRTRHEIANLPIDVALDLDIHPGDADKIAHDAVYGQ